MTGLTLPGMIDDPGCFAGSRISANPVRGPEDMSSRSSMILARSTASPRSDADMSSIGAIDCVAWTRCSAVRSWCPVCSDNSSTTARMYSGSALRPVPYGGRADVLLGEALRRLQHPCMCPPDGEGIRRELLAQPDGHRVLHMGATRLEHTIERHGSLGERLRQPGDSVERFRGPVERGHTHGGREGVVGRLRHVHVVIRTHDGVVATATTADALGAEELDGPVGEHLVGVHVVADARSCLEGVDPEGVDEQLLLGLAGRCATVRCDAQDLRPRPR